MMNIPQQFRSKIGVYHIQLDGVRIKANVVDPNFSLETAISEFKSHIETDLPVVGVDFKASLFSPSHDSHPKLLLLFAKDRCLIIQLSLIRRFPKCLGLFLSDNSICFVGYKIDDYFSRVRDLASDYHGDDHDTGLTGNGAEIRLLAATVLKKPSLTECDDLFQLASETGLIEMKNPENTSVLFDSSARVFSEEEIEYAVHKAYYCHKLGKKLLGML